jgi:hypothetical protein
VDDDFLEFKSWLKDVKGFSPAVAKDILSRLNRVERIASLPALSKPDDEICMLLAREKEFNALSSSVRSQLRRSLALYSEFKRK